MKRLTDDGLLVDFLSQEPDPTYSVRQNLPQVYYPVGSIFVIKPGVLLKQDSFYTDETYAYLVPGERAMDIDTDLDFRMAEFLLEEGIAFDSAPL